MKKNLLFACLILSFGCGGDNNIMSGGIRFTEISGSQSGVLTRSESPYHVTGTLTVAAGTALQIEPGVSLFFDDSTMLIVQGRLEAVGAANARFIQFQAFDQPAEDDRWFGIKFVDSSAGSQMALCTIEDVRIDVADSLQNAAIEVIRSPLEIQNCIIRGNHTPFAGGLFATQAQVTVRNNIFRDQVTGNFGAAILCIESAAEIINNTIFNNRCINYGSGLVFIDQASSDIQNNIFFQNTSGAGDPRIGFFSGDSTNFNQAFNFLPFGDMNPEFLSNADLRLSTASPAIDMGNPDSAFNDVDGTRNDLGASGGPLGAWLR